MALKDWKKIKTRDNKKLYKKGRIEIEVQLTRVIGMGYRFCINNNCQYFKTKSQALRFAKAYMRTH